VPSSATTGQPQPAGVITLPHPIATGDSTTINITIPPDAGDIFCFQVTLLTDVGEECCTEKICVEMPDCGCAQLVDRTIECELQADGTVKYTIVLAIKNLTGATLSPYGFGYATMLPPAGFSPSLVSPTPNPIAPGATGTIKTCYYGSPGPLCFDLALHDANFTTCCSIEVCLDLPKCGDVKPDTCAMRDRFACCPPDGVTTVPFTLCNNSAVPRTYTWTASGIASATCTQTLTASNFTPASGTLGPIPPGGCMTGFLKVRCNNFDFGDCARFQICFSHNPLVPVMCCYAEIYRPKPGEPVIKIDTAIPAVPIGGTVPIKVTVVNPGDTPLSVPVLFFSEDGALNLGEKQLPGPIVADTFENESPRIVSLNGGESRDITVNVSLPQDPRTPFVNLAIFIGADSLDNVADVGPPIIVPIRVVGPALRIAALRVNDIAVEHVPQAQVVMQVPTESGHRYRVEQSASMLGGWDVSSCSVQDVITGPDGVFVGTGGMVTCRVPCGADEGLMFFRIRDLTLD
jgi:ribosomal protein S27E